MKVTFELPDQGEAAKRLKWAGEENGITVSSVASLLLQSAVTGRASGLLRPWMKAKKKKARGSDSGDSDEGSDEKSDSSPMPDQTSAGQAAGETDEGSAGGNGTEAEEGEAGALPMSKGKLKWMHAGREDRCKGNDCVEIINEGYAILWDGGAKTVYKEGCPCGTAEKLARDAGLRVPSGLDQQSG